MARNEPSAGSGLSDGSAFHVLDKHRPEMLDTATIAAQRVFQRAMHTVSTPSAGMDQERKHSRNPLADESRFRLIVDKTPALIYSACPDGYIDFFNQHCLKFLGLALEEIAGSGRTKLLHPDDIRSTGDRRTRCSTRPGGLGMGPAIAWRSAIWSQRAWQRPRSHVIVDRRSTRERPG